MAYDTVLAERIRAQVKSRPGFTEKQMFGGIGFLLHGNMCVGVWKESLILRLRPAADAALQEPSVREMDITGRPMAGWVLVEPSGFGRGENLRKWVELAVAHVATLPAKEPGEKKRAMSRKKKSPTTKRSTKRSR
jgi:TfoX/Sxy family transcriptional regulator of competence genes